MDPTPASGVVEMLDWGLLAGLVANAAALLWKGGQLRAENRHMQETQDKVLERVEALHTGLTEINHEVGIAQRDRKEIFRRLERLEAPA